MSWNSERKTFVTLVVLGAVVLFVSFFTLPFLLQAPSCNDGKQNGDEAGIDCGGSCALLCAGESIPLEILFERSVEVDATTYDAVAYVVNKNKDAVPSSLSFKVSLFDGVGSLIVQKEGKAFIQPGGGTPLYVPALQVGDRRPVRTRFEITQIGPFYKYSNQEFLKTITVRDHVFDNTNVTPRLTLTIQNSSFETVRDIDVYALLYDSEDTLIAVGKTYLESVSGNNTKNAYFSWRTPFSSPARFEFVLIKQPRFQ